MNNDKIVFIHADKDKIDYVKTTMNFRQLVSLARGSKRNYQKKDKHNNFKDIKYF